MSIKVRMKLVRIAVTNQPVSQHATKKKKLENLLIPQGFAISLFHFLKQNECIFSALLMLLLFYISLVSAAFYIFYAKIYINAYSTGKKSITRKTKGTKKRNFQIRRNGLKLHAESWNPFPLWEGKRRTPTYTSFIYIGSL